MGGGCIALLVGVSHIHTVLYSTLSHWMADFHLVDSQGWEYDLQSVRVHRIMLSSLPLHYS